MGRSPCCDKAGLKKGPWTQEEDRKLTQYIQIHGPGNWRTLPNNAGLQRCGKSCRLRWTNYLRPDIKRGRFSLEEEETIIQLHSVLGNKWSAIATRLPGRTDNEIKNYWNTHIRKKLLRNGIDPVTHTPRLDLSHLSSILNSAQINLSNLLGLQTLVNPDVLSLVTLLAASSSNQENRELLLHNHLASMNQTPNMQIRNCASTPSSLSSSQILEKANPMFATDGQYLSGHMVNHNDQNSQVNSVSLCSSSTDNSVSLPSYSPQFNAQNSENLSFHPSNVENNIPISQNFNFDSILSIPMSSPAHVNSSSTYNNSSGSEETRESPCSNMFKFEIPESFQFDDLM